MESKQLEMFKAETTWFHVFVSMIENGDVAKMGPYAVTVYLVVKAYTNWKTGKAFPSIDTIASKSGISKRQVINSLAVLTENGYLDKVKVGRKNNYTLRKKSPSRIRKAGRLPVQPGIISPRPLKPLALN